MKKTIIIGIFLFFVIYIILNRYTIVTGHQGTYKLNKLTGRISWIIGDKEHIVKFDNSSKPRDLLEFKNK